MIWRKRFLMPWTVRAIRKRGGKISRKVRTARYMNRPGGAGVYDRKGRS